MVAFAPSVTVRLERVLPVASFSFGGIWAEFVRGCATKSDSLGGDWQPRQIVIFFTRAASASRSIASCCANHSFEYGLRAGSGLLWPIDPTMASVFGCKI